ncbi:hypothetical protein DOO78_20685 [Roseicella frigidaeris]|uniref:Uncharacterized protein n=1 Tax=Roseicella frigidaeris TaxID=2230885 RepID=A0A327M1G0_9PROT|nr:hypothetical protein DOO78_20685 [Roseicella frigidaeris]
MLYGIEPLGPGQHRQTHLVAGARLPWVRRAVMASPRPMARPTSQMALRLARWSATAAGAAGRTARLDTARFQQLAGGSEACPA